MTLALQFIEVSVTVMVGKEHRRNSCKRYDSSMCYRCMFQVVAREIDTTEGKSSTATVTLHILDVNDNHPLFSNDSYVAYVAENSELNTPVIQLSVCIHIWNRITIGGISLRIN